jgi:23S rRNA (cytidine1920-2'-O)/16S rRNA (cytidine1409-2'-O)-methyltransferase
MKKRLETGYLDLVPSREQAQRYIRAGWVQVNQTVVDKPGTTIATDAQILVKQRSPYVSRGGEKLAGALQAFGIKVSDRICLMVASPRVDLRIACCKMGLPGSMV